MTGGRKTWHMSGVRAFLAEGRASAKAWRRNGLEN